MVSNLTFVDMTHISAIPQINQYVHWHFFAVLIALAFILIVAGYYMDLYPFEIGGYGFLFICAAIILSGNLITIVNDQFLPFNNWLSHWVGFFLLIASVAGFTSVLLTMRSNNAKQKFQS